MPTQVQSLMLPVYESIVEVASDTEVLTEASLINTAVALGSRIEFLRQQLGIVSDKPESFCVFEEDWLGLLIDPNITFGTPGYAIGDSGSWGATIIGGGGDPNISLDTTPVTSSHGSVRITGVGGTNGVCIVKGGMGLVGGVSQYHETLFRYSRMLRMVCHMRFEDSIAAPHKFEFGLTSSSSTINAANSAAISILYDPTLNANWLFRTSLSAAASATLTDSGVPPNVGNPQVLIMEQILASGGAGSVAFSIRNQAAPNGTTPVAPLTFVPAGTNSGSFGFKSQCNVGQAQTVDYEFLAMNSNTRS